jgi:hypothetical protein
MKLPLVVSTLALAAASPLLLAVDCPGSQVTGTDLDTFLDNQLICAYKFDAAPSNASRRWSEEHRNGGDLWEYARGATDTVDGSKDVGSWSVASDVISYTYDGDGTYQRQVYLDGSTYYFCTNATTPQQDAIVFFKSALPASGPNPCAW